MIRKKLGLHKIKESKESRNERYNCHRHLKKNSLVKIDSEIKNITLMAKNIGGDMKYVNILISKGYSVGFDLFYNL